MKIWERYLLARLCKTITLILIGLFGIYLTIDLSIHSVRFFADGKANALSVFLYYLHAFAMHLDLFFGLSYLLATLKVLFDLTHHSEFVALQMAGLSNRRLIRPLFLLASSLCLLSYANAQWLAPNSLESIDSFRSEHAKRKKQALREHVHALNLDDDSELVYQRFDPHRKILFDAYWIRTKNDLWHMKTLELGKSPLQARFADRLMRNEKGQLELKESYDVIALPDLPLSPSQALQKFIPFENRPLFTLLWQSFSKSSDKEMIRAHLHYKLSLPLLPLLIALLLPPLLLQFSRQKPTFLIAACSLVALISFLTILDGMLILAENRVLAPSLALWTPWLLCLGLSTKQFLRFS